MSIPEATAEYEFKRSTSPKLKQPIWIAYDDKGAAFTLAPFGMRKDVRIERIVTAVNEYDANKAKIEALTEALKNTLCHRCENRIGYTGPTTQYGDWRSCSSCAPARAALESPDTKENT